LPPGCYKHPFLKLYLSPLAILFANKLLNFDKTFWGLLNLTDACFCCVLQFIITLQYRAGVHNSNLKAGQKKKFHISQGQSWYVLAHSKDVLIKERSKINKIWGFTGQIKSFRGPHLSRGPYVVHAWYREMKKCIRERFTDLDKLNFVNLLMVVWFSAVANFHYFPNCLRKWRSLRKWLKVTQYNHLALLI